MRFCELYGIARLLIGNRKLPGLNAVLDIAGPHREAQQLGSGRARSSVGAICPECS